MSPQVLKLSCPNGKFSLDPDTTYFGLINQGDYAIYTMYQADYRCNNQEVFTNAIKDCLGKASCDVIFTRSWFKSDCENIDVSKLYLKMYCFETFIEVGGTTFSK